MNILSVAFPLFSVSANSGGGAEQILYLLERGLVQAGHCSAVVAAKGSQISGLLFETPIAEGEITEEIRSWAWSEHRRAIATAIANQQIDLIHFHGLDFYQYLPEEPLPKLATLHLPVEWYPPSIFELPNTTRSFVSKTQAQGRIGPVVINGIDVMRYGQSLPRGNSMLVLSRICPEKGIDTALRVAHRLALPLTIAGPVHPFEAHQRYFREQVQPLLDDKRQYIGPAGLEQKIRLLGTARCLLAPSLAPETSSLVAMEAMAAGTPVIAFRSGALPEVVDNGITGFIVDTEEEMAQAVDRVGQISSERCQRIANCRFSSSRMVADYLQIYRELISTGASQ